MTGRVPILRGDDELEALHQPVGRFHDRVAVWHAQRTARHEIILQVHDDQSTHKSLRNSRARRGGRRQHHVVLCYPANEKASLMVVLMVAEKRLPIWNGWWAIILAPFGGAS